MTDSEILLALSKMLEPIGNDVRELKTQMGRLETRMERLEERVGRLEERVERLETQMEELKTRVERLETQVEDLKTTKETTKKISLVLEVEMLPRLQNIEECYLSTFQRYQDSISEHEEMKKDIAVLKTVVKDHSKQLERIS